ncbi:hypothetical protein FB645_001240 [Coemansia sp. IMI 203386]|nr:hypothetical protein FB645_001240 [Coemansia sp. IMI 203386]
MNFFHIEDLSKPGSIDVVNGGATWTISYSPHAVDPCACEKCKAIKTKKAEDAKKAEAAKKAEEEKKKKQGHIFMAHLLANSGHPK